MHILTVDVEEWYHPMRFFSESRIPESKRLLIGMQPLLEVLEERHQRATFFWVADIARDHAPLIRELVRDGHEVGCHGLHHDQMIYNQTPDEFRQQTRLALDILRDITGEPIHSYRAPCFSITQRSLWALDTLAELGVRFDSSIFPVRNWRYGFRNFSKRPVRVAQEKIIEMPISVRSLLGVNIPVSGGAYFRIYPYIVTRSNFLSAEQAGVPALFYIHPWELDPSHPRVSFNRKASFTHYINLSRTLPRFRRLLTEFQFERMDVMALKNLSPNSTSSTDFLS